MNLPPWLRSTVVILGPVSHRRLRAVGAIRKATSRIPFRVGLGDRKRGFPRVRFLVWPGEGCGPVYFRGNPAALFEPNPLQGSPGAVGGRFSAGNVHGGHLPVPLVRAAMKDPGWGRIVFIRTDTEINTPAEMIHYGM